MASRSNGSIKDTVSRTWRRVWLSTMITGLCWWLAIGLGIWLALCLLDNLLHLPSGLRFPLALGGIAVTGAGFIRKIWRPATLPQKPESIAVMIESRYSVPDNLIINGFQFEKKQVAPEERFFANNTISASKQAVSRLRLAEFWEFKRLFKLGAIALAIMLLWAFYAVMFPRYVVNAWQRFVMPLRDVPPAGLVILKMAPSSDVVISEGDSIRVHIRVETESEAKHILNTLPLIVWQDNVRSVAPVVRAGYDHAQMKEDPKGGYTYSFTDVRRPFSFRVSAANTYTRSVHVDVRAIPKIMGSLFRISPPFYTGLASTNIPGPSAPVSCLPGSILKTSLDIVPAIQSAIWKESGKSVEFKRINSLMESETIIDTAGSYEIETQDPVTRHVVSLARGSISLETDKPPEVEFLFDNLNRFVNPGTTVLLDLQAADDYGIRNLAVTLSTIEPALSERVLKQWAYIGPPGNRGPVKEHLSLCIDPELFTPGTTFLLTATGWDFSPGNVPGKSRPLVLRVKTASELSVPPGDSLEKAFALLRRTIAVQEKANAVTENLRVHLNEAWEKGALPNHQNVMSEKQESARGEGKKALAEFTKHQEGRPYAWPMAPLVEHEMAWVIGDIAAVANKSISALPVLLTAIEERQTYILAELLKLLGRIAEEKTRQTQSQALAEDDQSPVVKSPDSVELKDDLTQFTRHQKRIIEISRSLADHGPEDLTETEQKILGTLAREEAKWAAFFEEKLTDFSKLPLQDFADGSIAQELNEVVQEVKLAANSLYEKAVELAVPHEQAGLENAEELINNLERWLSDKPDRLKWLMEEAMAPADIAMAELPSELEDIVGELIDKEEEMTEDVEDVSSSWLDSIDKGAGWDAVDGPISSMGAKGITGNLLPNQQEIGGRSGEGRTGRSHGQIVEETAKGKGGRNTPSRLTPSPFEQGSVKDASSEEPGGATGGGKLAGFTGEGLRGPTPPPMLQKMKRLAGQQAAIRQEAETLALKLRKYHLPTGDLETSIQDMKRLESAARQGYGLGIRQSFSRVMDSLYEANRSVRVETGLHREHTRLPEGIREEILAGLQDRIPRGYEEMVGAYFRALAEDEWMSRPSP